MLWAFAFGIDHSIERMSTKPVKEDLRAFTAPNITTPIIPITPKPEPVKEPVREEPKSSRSIAREKIETFGWDEKQFECLENLWEKESNWNHEAANPKSSAYGIPQALPGERMSSEGEDWQTNPKTQIRWGLKYIYNRYEKPCNAWQFWIKNNWY